MPHQISKTIAALFLLTLIAPALLLAKDPKPAQRSKESQKAQDARETAEAILEEQRVLNPEGNIIILATGQDFPTLKRQAQKIARTAGLPFSLRDMIYNAKLGLHVPPNDPDVMWRNAYFFRREDSMTLPSGKESYFVSIEKSDAYPGLKPGYYIIVGGISFTPKETKTQLALYRKAASAAYAAKTTIYMGCMH